MDENTWKQWNAFREKLNLESTTLEFEAVITQIQAFLWPVNQRIQTQERMIELWNYDEGWTANA